MSIPYPASPTSDTEVHAGDLAAFEHVEPFGIGPWFKCFAKITDSEVFADANVLKVFVWCLAKASKEWAYCRDVSKVKNIPVVVGRATRIIKLLYGDFVFGRHTAATELSMPGTTVVDRMNRLEAMNAIKVTSVTNCSIVTVCNWQTYQFESTNVRQPSVNCPSTDRQPSVTTKRISRTTRNQSSSRALRFDEADRVLAEHISKAIRDLQPTRAPPDLDRWANSIRLAREQDGRTLDDLRDVFDHAHRDPFWQTIVLGPDKLREKFDDLDLKLRRPANHDHRPANGNSPARIRSGRYADDKLTILRPEGSASA